ncbi:MAG TPA: tyrosine-type recombinase/integrase [Sphingomicrobium sp.]|nr:tyrosine-type recombinase/integrase [Sphingomicrobium sp.]
MTRLTDTTVKAMKPPAAGQAEHPDEMVTGLRLRIGAGGRKAWIVRTRAGGKPINRTLGRYPIMSLAKARSEAQKLLLEIATAGAPQEKRTFRDLLDHWLDHDAKANNRSWKLQKRQADIHVIPAWANRPIESITRADVRELIDGIEGTVAPNRVLALVRRLFRHALSRDWIQMSPAEAIEKPKAERARDRFLEMDEVKRIWAASDLLGYPYGPYVKMLLLTGQRRTEVASMRWADIDIDAATWIMCSDDTKSERAHLVPLAPQAVEMLRHAPRMGPYVWTTKGETYAQNYTKAKAKLDGFLAAGTDGEIGPWRLHDLRRTLATHMVRLGVSEIVVGRVLNHALQGVTARVYALHSYASEKRSALDRWAAEIDRAVAGRKVDNVVAING